ncbi:MAG TPA: hypothetical protein VMR37_03645 [Rhabdochlamydiaceae bacterium]|nr:hypothetical protein [Rhabdochlamydiaceae bacterium]
MASAAPVYLRTLPKIENNIVNEEIGGTRWIVYSIALGALSYYAPKTFLATSLGLTLYQIYDFHQAVRSKGIKEIRACALHICAVMSSIGTVLGLQCLPWFGSSLKAARHFHLFRSAGHGLAGISIFVGGFAGLFSPFTNTEKKLSAMREWVEMTDFLENYPRETKKSISRTAFFESALLPDTFITTGLAAGNLIFNQFRSPQLKLARLATFFGNAKLLPSIPQIHTNGWEQWTVAIHQFQGLPIEAQLALGPQLARIAKASFPHQTAQLPEEVRLVLLNEHLKSFVKIPPYGEEKYGDWMTTTVKYFNNLNADQQAILGEQISRIIRSSSVPGQLAGSDKLRRAALKHSLKLNVQNPSAAEWAWAQQLMESIPIDMYKNFGPDAQALAGHLPADQMNALPPLVQFSMLHHTLSFQEQIPIGSYQYPIWTRIGLLYHYLPVDMRSHPDIDNQLRRIARASDQGLISALSHPALRDRLIQLKASCGSVTVTEG